MKQPDGGLKSLDSFVPMTATAQSVAKAVSNETFVGTITDNTDGKQAEQDLRERAAQLQRSSDELVRSSDDVKRPVAESSG